MRGRSTTWLALAAAATLGGVAAMTPEADRFDNEAAYERFKANRKRDAEDREEQRRQEQQRQRPIIDAANAKRARRAARNLRIAGLA